MRDMRASISQFEIALDFVNKMHEVNQTKLENIVNNWIANNPIQNGMIQFIASVMEILKEYMKPPTPVTADQLLKSKQSMNSDDINPIPENEYDNSKW